LINPTGVIRKFAKDIPKKEKAIDDNAHLVFIIYAFGWANVSIKEKI
jgi:hypothetical protein